MRRYRRPHLGETIDYATLRERLRGSLIKCEDGTFLTVPSRPSNLPAKNTRFLISRNGGAHDAAQLAEHKIRELYKPTHIIYGILTDSDGAAPAAASIRVGDLPASIEAVVNVSASVSEVSVTIGGDPPVVRTADMVDIIIGLPWLPWDGAPRMPPAIPAAPGIPLLGDASIQGVQDFMSAQGGPGHVMRSAALGMHGITITTCKEAALLACGLSLAHGQLEPIIVGLAAASTPTREGEGPPLTATRAAALAVIHTLGLVIDRISEVGHSAILKASQELREIGFHPTLTQTATFVRQAILAAEAKAKALVEATAVDLRRRAERDAASLMLVHSELALEGLTHRPLGELNAHLDATVMHPTLEGVPPQNHTTLPTSLEGVPPQGLSSVAGMLASMLAAAGSTSTPANAAFRTPHSHPPQGPTTPGYALTSAGAATVPAATTPLADPRPFFAEAARHLARVSLPPAEMGAAIRAVAASLAAAAPPLGASHSHPLPAGGASYGIPRLAAFRPAHSDHLTIAEVFQAIATALGKQPLELTTMLGDTVGRALEQAVMAPMDEEPS